MRESKFDPTKFLSGKFESLEAAKKSGLEFSKSGESFTSSRWFQRQETFWKDSLVGESPRPSTLPKVIEKSHAEMIIEVGGGSGWIWNLIGSEIRRNLTYVNLELAETCNYFENLTHFEPAMRFISTLDDLELKANYRLMLYSNSTMQYLDDDGVAEIFRTLNSCTEVLLDELIFTDFSSYWTLQEYYGSKIPYFVRNRSDFLGNMAAFGFEPQAQNYSKRINSADKGVHRPYFTENLHFLKTH